MQEANPQLLIKTVPSDYKAPRPVPTYDSIEQIEQKLIEQLLLLGYENAQELTTETDLVNNLKKQIENLNTKRLHQEFVFAQTEWIAFFKRYLEVENDFVERKLRVIQQEYFPSLEGENSHLKQNIFLIDKSNLNNNFLQIAPHPQSHPANENIQQLNVLINGFPLVHIILVPPKADLERAYQKLHSVIANSLTGLFEYIHIFVLSNGSKTKWYAADLEKGVEKIRNTQEFKTITNFWTDRKHVPIRHIGDFTSHFFRKEKILSLLINYCIIAESKLIVLKPYQIDASESIFNHIIENLDNAGSKSAGGYVWHSTGSGKTLTAFMSCKLIQKISEIEKIFLLEDRNALEFQVNKEFERFGSGQDFSNTEIIWANKGDKLTEVLENSKKYKNKKMLLTTIQKLYKFCADEEKESELFNQKVVFIIDECHRDNFGKMHASIIKRFKKYFCFGFTGTPIFEENSIDLKDTTENYFGKQIGPSYTLYRSIKDGNSLPFWLFKIQVDEEGTAENEHNKTDEKRIKKIANTIWNEFESKTNQNEEKFNSILATKNIPQAIKFHDEFKKLNERDPNGKKLVIACVFTSTSKDKDKYRKIRETFRDEFASLYKKTPQDYERNKKLREGQEDKYKEVVTEAFKERKIDLLIVADMFLTGFDAPRLNTLWLDKPSIKWHTLIQTFSRTNRPYRNKKAGMIVSFNDIDESIDEAINMFSEIDDDKDDIYKKFSREEFYKDKAEIEEQIKTLDLLKQEIDDSTGYVANSLETQFIRACRETEDNLKRLRNYGELWRNNFEEEQEEKINQFSEFKEQLIKERSKRREQRSNNSAPPPQEEQEENIEDNDTNFAFSLERSGTKIDDKYIKLCKWAKEKARFSDRAIQQLKKAIKAEDKDLINSPGWISKRTNLSYNDPKRDKIIEEIRKLSEEIIDREINKKAEILDISLEEEST